MGGGAAWVCWETDSLGVFVLEDENVQRLCALL